MFETRTVAQLVQQVSALLLLLLLLLLPDHVTADGGLITATRSRATTSHTRLW
jgi:hypothetical protein